MTFHAGLKIGLLSAIVGLMVACSSTPLAKPASDPSATPAPVATSVPPKPLEYKRQELPHSVVYTVLIPTGSPYQVVSAIAEKVATVEQFAQGYGAIAAVNGGFFDPTNQKSTSAVIVQGKALAVPETNERLMKNPDLLPYLDKILNHSEFRQYQCAPGSGQGVGQTGGRTYAIALRQSLPTPGCQIAYTLGAGPQLIPQITLAQEGFTDSRDGKMIRDALGSTQRNARTAVGMTQNGSVVWVMVAQKPEDPTNSGMTLPELADFLKTLKLETAINLDGGSSSALYYNGQTHSGKVNEAGTAIARPIKSVLLILPTSK